MAILALIKVLCGIPMGHKEYLTKCKEYFTIMVFDSLSKIFFAGDEMKLMNGIRKLRFEKGEMSQQELADLIDVSRMTIYSIEKGKYVPSTALALKMSRVFGRPVEQIFWLVEDNEDGGKQI